MARSILQKNKMQTLEPNGFDVDQVFGATKRQLRRFWEKHYFQYCIFLSARVNAKDTLSKLRKEGNKIIIVTGRMLSYEKSFIGAFMRRSVKLWLWRNRLVYDEIIFYQENILKTDLCDKLNIDIMIEDKPQNVLSISKAIPVICFDASYNKCIECENIQRAYNRDEIYFAINKML